MKKRSYRVKKNSDDEEQPIETEDTSVKVADVLEVRKFRKRNPGIKSDELMKRNVKRIDEDDPFKNPGLRSGYA